MEVVVSTVTKDKDKDKDKDKRGKSKKTASDSDSKNDPPRRARKTLEAAIVIMHQHMYAHDPRTACEQFKALLSHPSVKHSVADLRSLAHKRQTIVSAIADLEIVLNSGSGSGSSNNNTPDAATRAYLEHLDSQITQHARLLRSNIVSVFRLHRLHPVEPLVVFQHASSSGLVVGNGQQWCSALVLPSLRDLTTYAYKRDDDTWYDMFESALVKAVVNLPAATAYPVLVLGYSVVGYHACLLVEEGVVLQQHHPEFLDVLHSLVFKNGVDKKWLKDVRECVAPNRFCHRFTRFDMPAVLACVPAIPSSGALVINENLIRSVVTGLGAKLKIVITGEVIQIRSGANVMNSANGANGANADIVGSDSYNIYVEYPELFKLIDTGWTDHVIAALSPSQSGVICEDMAAMTHFRAHGVIVCIENTPPLYVRYVPRGRGSSRYFEGVVSIERYIVDAVYRLVRACKGKEPFSTHTFGGLATSQCTVAEGIFVDHAITPNYVSIEWLSLPTS